MAGNEKYFGGSRRDRQSIAERITLNTAGQKPFQLNQGGK